MLPEIIEAIRSEHNAVVEASQRAHARALHLGEMLLQVRQELGPVAWEFWLRHRCPISARAARRYANDAERLKQAAKYDYNKILNGMIFLRPTIFEEQKKDFDKLRKIVDKSIGLIVVDTIGMLYRLEMGKSSDIYSVNRELGKQISYLNEIVRKKHIPVVLTNQVYADFEDKDKVKIVGGDLLKYSSKCLLELQISPAGNRKVVLRKHR